MFPLIFYLRNEDTLIPFCEFKLHLCGIENRKQQKNKNVLLFKKFEKK